MFVEKYSQYFGVHPLYPPFSWGASYPTPDQELYPQAPVALGLKLKPTSFLVLLVNVSKSGPKNFNVPTKFFLSIFFLKILWNVTKKKFHQNRSKNLFLEKPINFFWKCWNDFFSGNLFFLI